jgi:mono/diheme cytochrome c family protein
VLRVARIRSFESRSCRLRSAAKGDRNVEEWRSGTHGSESRESTARARMCPSATSSELRSQSEGFAPPTNHKFKQQREKSEGDVMLFRSTNIATSILSLITASLGITFLLFLMCRPHLTSAQEAGRSREVAKTSDKAKLVGRGKYLVEGVAGCGYCHTPRDSDGNPDRAKWLAGAPVFYEPARPVPGWANSAPRLAGLPPGSDAELIRLLTTSVSRSGQPPRWPMPRFYMTRTDAEAVVAYLKSVDISQR